MLTADERSRVAELGLVGAVSESRNISGEEALLLFMRFEGLPEADLAWLLDEFELTGITGDDLEVESPNIAGALPSLPVSNPLESINETEDSDADPPESAETATPHWDPELRELTLECRRIRRRFRSNAKNVFRVLACFTEDGWLNEVFNPFAPTEGRSAEEVCDKTLRHLNRGLEAIRFSRDGSRILWARIE
jgi:hypothetical protein